jgi:hypothetical protein
VYQEENKSTRFQIKAKLYRRAASEGRGPEMIKKLCEIYRRVTEGFQEHAAEIDFVRSCRKNGASQEVMLSNAFTFWSLQRGSAPLSGSLVYPQHSTIQ